MSNTGRHPASSSTSDGTLETMKRLGVAGRVPSTAYFVPGRLSIESQALINKKLGQLTRVIVQLNEVRVDHDHRVACIQYEHDTAIDALQAKHDKAMQDLTRNLHDSNLQITTLRETASLLQVEESKREELGMQLCTSQESVANMKLALDASDAAHRTLKLKLQDAEGEARRAATHQAQLDAQVESLLKDVDKANAEVQRSNKAQKKAEEEAAARLKKREAQLSKEMGSLRAQHKSDIDSMHKDMQDVKAENGELVENVDRLEAQLKNAQLHAAAETQKLRDEIASLKTNLEEVVTAHGQGCRDTAQLSADLAEKDHRILHLQKELSAAQHEQAELEKDNADLKASSNILQVTNRSHEEDGRKRAAELGSLQGECIQLRSVVKTQNAELARVNAHCLELEKQRAQLEMSQDQATDQLNTRLTHLVKENQTLTKRQTELKAQLATEAQDLRASHARKEQEFEERLARRLKQAEGQAEERIARELDARRKKHGADVEQLKRQHADALKLREDEFTAKCSAVEAKSHRTVTDLRSKCQESEKVASQAQARLTKLEADFQAQGKAMEERRDNLSTTSDELAAVRTDLARAASELADLRADKLAASKDVKKLELELMAARQENESKTRALEQEHKTALAKQNARLADQWTKRLADECGRLRSEFESNQDTVHRSTVAQMAELHAQQLDTLREERQTLEATRREEFEACKTEVKTLQAALTEAKQASKQTQEDLTTASKRLLTRDRQMTSELAAANKRYEELNQRLTAELNKLKEQLERREVAQRCEVRERQEAEAGLRHHLEQDKQLAIETAAKQAARQLELELERVRSQHEQKRNEDRDTLERMYSESMREQTRRQEQEKSDLMEKVLEACTATSAAKMESEQRLEKIQALGNDLAQSTQAAEKLKEEIRALNESVDTIRQEKLESLEDMYASLKSEHKQEMTAASEMYRVRLQEVSQRVQAEQETWKASVYKLEEELKESAEALENRPPRPEDLAAIRDLESELIMQRETIRTLQDASKDARAMLAQQSDMINKVYLAGSKNPFQFCVETKPKKPPQQLPPLPAAQRRGSAPQIQVGAQSKYQLAKEEQLKSRSQGVMISTKAQQEILQRLHKITRDAWSKADGPAQQLASTAGAQPPGAQGHTSSLPPIKTSKRAGEASPTARHRTQAGGTTTTQHASEQQMESSRTAGLRKQGRSLPDSLNLPVVTSRKP
eukprot:scpid15137/ scgid1191/ 